MSTTLVKEIEPHTAQQALTMDQWRHAIGDEFNAALRNNTWDLVPPNEAPNLVGNKWIFRIKFLPDGSIDKYKARLVAKGFHQRPGIDYHETFSPVVKSPTIRLVLGLAVKRDWLSNN